MESSFFYGLSTIAQTLAGAIAVLAALLLYKLQSADALLDVLANRLPRKVNVSRSDYFIRYRKFHLLLKFHKANASKFLKDCTDAQKNQYKQMIENFEYELTKRTSLVRALTLSLGLTGVTIFFCVLSIFSYQFLRDRSEVIVGIFVVSSVLLLACLVSYLVAIRKSMF